MKLSVTIARILVGSLFIFSGLIKAIDPLGLTYKMQEFFEVWGREGYFPSLMNWVYNYAFSFSIIMITLEIVLGVALLTGWRKKLILRLLLLLMAFFLFLTSYVLFSGKIATCGCFGDCIPITPIQTFTKDIVLIILIILLLAGEKFILPLFKNVVPGLLVLISTIAVILLQAYVIKHLPLKDCLPFKVGNDILKLREMPTNAVPDKFEYSFIYQKNGEKKNFDADKLPDSTWTFIDRKQTLVKKGTNNIPIINDFSLTDTAGIDFTETVLGQKGKYYLFFLKDMEMDTAKWSGAFNYFVKKAKEQNIPLYIITAERAAANHFFNEVNKYNLPILSCDATVIKTAARANPTLFLMKGPIVQGKWSWADIDKAIKTN